MAKRRIPKTLPMITLLRGGYGKLETGRILATRTTTHTVGATTVELVRHIVQMENKVGCFGASVRFVFGQSAIVNIGKEAA